MAIKRYGIHIFVICGHCLPCDTAYFGHSNLANFRTKWYGSPVGFRTFQEYT
jgi:hypothetical protein